MQLVHSLSTHGILIVSVHIVHVIHLANSQYFNTYNKEYISPTLSFAIWAVLALNWQTLVQANSFMKFMWEFENFVDISLLDLDLGAFSFHFSFSISISMHFHFTFHSRKEWKENKIHFLILKKSDRISDFTPLLEKKEWNCVWNFAFCHEKFPFLMKVKVC